MRVLPTCGRSAYRLSPNLRRVEHGEYEANENVTMVVDMPRYVFFCAPETAAECMLVMRALLSSAKYGKGCAKD